MIARKPQTMSVANIRLLPVDNTPPMTLLLLADPSEDAIRAYLSLSHCLLAEMPGNGVDDSMIAGIIVLLRQDAKTMEVMNLAVDERYQQQGLGRQLLNAGIEYAKACGVTTLKIATGNSSLHQLKLYQSCGFEITQIVTDYFVEHYPEPIFEAGIQCRDRIELTLTVK